MKVLDHGFIELKGKTGHIGASVVDSARCSFGSKGDDLGDRDRKLINYLLGNGHTSPFRHAYFTFHIKAPLFVFRQWWKHQVGSSFREYETDDGQPVTLSGVDRIDTAWPKHAVVANDIMTDTDKGCSWNELSGRYKVMDPEFYVPEKARRNTGKQSSEEWKDEGLTWTMIQYMEGHNKDAVRKYDLLLKEGLAKELARLVLPPTIYSECYWTVSLQAVLHFLSKRLEPDAQWETREYAKGVLELVRGDLEAMGVEV